MVALDSMRFGRGFALARVNSSSYFASGGYQDGLSCGREILEVQNASFLEQDRDFPYAQSGFVLLLLACVGGLLAFLRNEAKLSGGLLARGGHFRFFAVGFDFDESGVGFVEGALVRGLIAE